ncbi:MAG: hypothetical protein AB8H80_10155 [Planctomycetota bacterium]
MLSIHRISLVAVASALAFLAAPALAQRTYSGWFDSTLGSGQLVYLGRTQSQWVADLAQATSFGLTPTHIEAYRDNGGPMLFDTAWHAGPPPAVVLFDRTASEMLQSFNTNVGAGARVLAFASYLGPQNERRYFVTYSATGLSSGGYVELGIPEANVPSRYSWAAGVGLRIQFMEAYRDSNGDVFYDVTFEPGSGPAALSMNMTYSVLQSSILSYGNAGMVMTSFESIWSGPNTPGPTIELFTAVFRDFSGSPSLAVSDPEPVSTFGPRVNSEFQAGRGLRCFESRVRVDPTASFYGTSLPGTNGTAPGQAGGGDALVGQDIVYALRSHDRSLATTSIGILALGFAPTNVPVLGGQLLVDPVTSFGVTLAPNAAWTFFTAVPAFSDPSLVGLELYSQLFQFAAGQQQGLLMSVGLQRTIGRYQ